MQSRTKLVFVFRQPFNSDFFALYKAEGKIAMDGIIPWFNPIGLATGRFLNKCMGQMGICCPCISLALFSNVYNDVYFIISTNN